MTTLRLLTYNVHSLRDDRGALTEVIAAARPDVAVLQEAPRRLRWRSRCAALARETGLVYVAGGRDSGGNLLLASTRARASTRTAVARRLPTLHRTAPMRGLVAGSVAVGDVRIGVVGIHLGLAASERQSHLPWILAAAADLDAPTVVAGDLNEGAGGRSWQRFADAGYADAAFPYGAATFTAVRPRSRIDGVLASSGVPVRRCGVPDIDSRLLERASDHLPVLAEIGSTPER